MPDKELVEVLKALANETRQQILEWLKEPKRNFPDQDQADVMEVGVCVKFIQKKAGLSQSTISHYLAILEKAELVTMTREGQWTYYRRNEPGIRAFQEKLAERL